MVKFFLTPCTTEKLRTLQKDIATNQAQLERLKERGEIKAVSSPSNIYSITRLHQESLERKKRELTTEMAANPLRTALEEKILHQEAELNRLLPLIHTGINNLSFAEDKEQLRDFFNDQGEINNLYLLHRLQKDIDNYIKQAESNICCEKVCHAICGMIIFVMVGAIFAALGGRPNPNGSLGMLPESSAERRARELRDIKVNVNAAIIVYRQYQTLESELHVLNEVAEGKKTKSTESKSSVIAPQLESKAEAQIDSRPEVVTVIGLGVSSKSPRTVSASDEVYVAKERMPMAL